MLAYALTIFLGAFLLFQIQPLIGKYILPWFGGAPAVWTTCMLFFQLLLLAGYLYAHGVVNGRKPRREGAVHVALLALSVLLIGALAAAWATPLLPGPSWKPADPADPVGRILILLTISVG
ncbi:MAG TPA: ferrichrome ABC transporter permease, partial [Thermoanaerobaculia bacterium]|nr:ferrichrome ABC transporter permease [Thermoanaerobaculia bacterium]